MSRCNVVMVYCCSVAVLSRRAMQQCDVVVMCMVGLVYYFVVALCCCSVVVSRCCIGVVVSFGGDVVLSSLCFSVVRLFRCIVVSL